MNDHEIPVPPFGVDNDPARVDRLERQIGRLRAELVAVRRALQQQRLRADAAEAELAERREADR
ncbi:hypothetical protein [Brachybacterium paraconglomeratum]|uniref:hypothetical protein n=1 Tax=Brachybacterium paraconglomeratum TaxID=173362 RepID=UPI003F7CB6AB